MLALITENYIEAFAALGALVTAATFITKLTPTKRDDEIVSKISRALTFISLNLLKK